MDKLGTDPCLLYSGASLQWTSWGRILVSYTVEPLYKGQVGDGSLSLKQVEPLYKGQVGDGSLSLKQVEPLYKGQVVLFSEVTNVLSLLEVLVLSSSFQRVEVACMQTA